MTNEELVRRERLESLRKNGVNPYPAQSNRSNSILDILDNFEDFKVKGESLCVSGRLRAIRRHGALTFLTLQDASGKIQIVLKRDNVKEGPYDFFHEHADLGDFFEFSGEPFLTQRGEKSIIALNYRMLAKALLPLPEKWSGLKDTEKRYRQRYLDLIVNEDAKKTAIFRSKMVGTMRSFLAREGFMEVETPILQPIAGGANARPFKTRHNTLHHDFYLRIAPELYLKRLIVGGFEKIYEYARCFRNEGISPQHNPEFTQIELYWAYATIEDLMDHLERMLGEVMDNVVGSRIIEWNGHKLNFETSFPRRSYKDLIEEYAGVKLDDIKGEEELKQVMEDLGVRTEGIIGEGELIDYLYKEKVRPSLIGPLFVVDYPASTKPLAKKRDDGKFSSAAQLLIGGLEVWNGFNELNDPLEQEERFMEQEGLRERGSEDAQRIDDDYLNALKCGMPPTAGYGIGIDRLAMILTDSVNLKEVILFPTLKPIDESQDDEE
ncbi:lysine--tRNA ligase [Patescibacteria group bacterium]|nr:lysine--tRNA ligase [Patescibacteria group bacterium]